MTFRILTALLTLLAPALHATTPDRLRDVRAEWVALMALEKTVDDRFATRLGSLTPMSHAWTAASWLVLATTGHINPWHVARATFNPFTPEFSPTPGFRGFWIEVGHGDQVGFCRVAVIADGDLADRSFGRVAVFIGACTADLIPNVTGGLADHRVDFTREQLKHQTLNCSPVTRANNEICANALRPIGRSSALLQELYRGATLETVSAWNS